MFDLELDLPLLQLEDLNEHTVQLRTALCTCISELARSDTNAHDIVQLNGIYIIAQFILPPPLKTGTAVANTPPTTNVDVNSQRNLQVPKKTPNHSVKIGVFMIMFEVFCLL